MRFHLDSIGISLETETKQAVMQIDLSNGTKISFNISKDTAERLIDGLQRVVSAMNN